MRTMNTQLTPHQVETWDALLVQNPDGGNVFQSQEMAETKRRGGWTPQYLMINERAVTVLEKRVPLLGNYWYIPKGPGVTEASQIIDLLPSLKKNAKQAGAFVVKIEPELLESDQTKAALREAGLVSTAAVQPNVSTVLLDLSHSIDEVMASLNQKGRHAIRRAERDGVIAAPVELTEENMRLMYDLLRNTAAGRFESSIRDYEYYREFWTAFSKTGRGQLFFAHFEEKLVAGAYCMYLGKKGLYKDGASIREKTAYGASHLLQWEVIKWMKEHGVESYDFCGAPHSTRINDESHKFYGVGRFKTSFNKTVTDYVGCYDLIIAPAKYALWRRFGQRIIVSLEWRLRHRQWF